MPSNNQCCVPGCPNREGRHAPLHQFPNPEKDRDRFNTWLYAIGGDILDHENERIYKYRRVCDSHFEEKYRCRNSRISNIAVPTLNMPDTLTMLKFTHPERKPMQEITNVMQPSTSTDFGVSHHEIATAPMIDHKSVSQKDSGVSHHEIATAPMIDDKSVSQEDSGVSHHEIATAPMIDDKSVSQEDSGVRHHEIATAPIDDQSVSQKQNTDPEVNPLPLEKVEQGQVRPTKCPSVETSRQNPGEKKTGVKKSTRRLLFFTEKERELYVAINTAKIKICKLKNKVKRQTAELKAAKKLSSDSSALKTIENCSSAAKTLMQIQWREMKKKGAGRRFTLQEKIIALTILKQSPKGYRFLRKLFILPAPQTLIKLVQKSNLQPGINKKVFLQLQKKTSNMKVEEKLCILLFDEVSLKAQLSYNERKGKVTGFIDNGEERKAEFADHAQVFMVRGLLYNYKQPVAYTFAASATKGPELAKQIKDIISELQRAGLIVVATVCDQGTNNCSALKMLLNETRGVYLRRGEEPKENVILINNEEIIPLYDPPHLLKGIRNNLLTKDLKYNKEGVTKTAKWSHLQALHRENPGYKGLRLVPKLTEDHVNPEKNKMKVKYASQVFSRTVAANMGYLADKKILPEESKDTADILLLMDNVFDSVNGSYGKNRHAKPLLGPATPTSAHWKMWAEARKIFGTMMFVTTVGRKESVPTVANWVWTLNAIEVLLKNVKEMYGVTSVWMRHLNQDPLENFFGAIRSHGCRNVNPTCDQFQAAFASLLINNLNSVNTRGKNCEGDLCDALYALVVDNPSEPPSTCLDIDSIVNINITPMEEKEKDARIIAPLVSGYFLKMAKNKIFHDCSECTEHMISAEEMEYISYREYAGKRWLSTPSAELISLISEMQDVLTSILKQHLEKPNLNDYLRTAMLTLIDFNFIKCCMHKKRLTDYLISFVIKFFTFHYCKNINKILAGRRDVDDDDDINQTKARKYHKKCFKRKK